MNILELPDASLCVRLAATMGHFLWQGAAVYLLVIFAGLLLRLSSAGARYAVFTAALLVMAVCPPVTFVLLRSPEGPATTVGGQSPLYVRSEVETPAAFVGGQSPPYLGGDSPASPAGSRLQAAPTAAEPVSLAVPPEPAVEAIDWWRYAPWLVACYLGGTTLMFARLLVALCGGQRLRRRSEPVDDSAILAAFARQARALGLRFTPAIAFCREVGVPTVVGVLRPMVLLPLSAVSGLTTEQIEVLLAHELAHIRRYDHVVNILQRLIEAALFFHPAVWFISRRIRIEREHCCDDLVLAVGGQRFAYAESLVRMAELSRGSQRSPYGTAAAALGAVDRPSQLRLRILRLVSGNTGEQVRLLRPAVLGLCLFLMLAAVACVQLASRPTEDRPIEAVPPGMVGTWFFENPMGDDEQMAVFPDGRIVVLYSNGHRDETRYADGAIDLAEYGNLKARLMLLPDGRTLQTGTGHSGIAKLWQRIDAAPKTELLRLLIEAPAATQPTTHPADALAWGEAVDGLQVAVELVPAKEAYAYGEKIDVRFRVRNVGDRTIQLATATLRQDRAEIRDEGGTIREVPSKWYSGWAIIVRHELEPGQEVTLESTGLGIVQESQELESPWRQTGVRLKGKPGRYAIRYLLPFPDVRRERPDGTVSVPQPTDWQGTLNTGWRELTVKLPDDVAERRAAAAEAVRLPDDLTWAFDPTPGLEIGVHESRLRFRLGTKTLDLDVVDGKVRAAWSDGAKQNEVVGKVVRIDRPASGDSGASTREPVLIDVVDGKPLTNDAASPLLDAARPSFVKGKLRFRSWGSASHLIDTHEGKLRIWEPDRRRMIESQLLRYGGPPPAPSTAPAARPDTRPAPGGDVGGRSGDLPYATVSLGQPEAPGGESRAWYVLRQLNCGPLLREMPLQFAKASDPAVEASVLREDFPGGVPLEIDVRLEDGAAGEILVGLFTDEKWSQAPVRVLKANGAGRYTITGVPPGKYQVGAMIGDVLKPKALGVHKSWPQPVEVTEGKSNVVETLVSPRFERALGQSYRQIAEACQPGRTVASPDSPVRGRVTDSSGKPVAHVIVQIRQHGLSPGPMPMLMMFDTATDDQGHYFLDKKVGRFTIGVLCQESLPAILGSRSQWVRASGIRQGKAEINFDLKPFPRGSATLSGRCADQDGKPVQGLLVILEQDVEIDEEEQSQRTYSYRVPCWASDGRFALTDLPPGKHRMRWIPLDHESYEFDPAGSVDVEMKEGQASDVAILIRRKEALYGRVLMEDGSVPPAAVKPSWPGALMISSSDNDGAMISLVGQVDSDGYVMVRLAKKDREALDSGEAVLSINYPNPGVEKERVNWKRVGVFPFEELSADRAKAGVVKIRYADLPEPKPDKEKRLTPATQPVPGSDLSAKHTIGSSGTAPRTREQEFEERARALRAEVEAETPEETVRNLSYKTYEIISSTRSLQSLFATHGEEAIDDINKDPRVQKLLRLIHEGDDAQRRALRDAVLKMVNIYLTELPDSTPANAAWRPSVMHPGGGIAYAYLLTQLDVDPVSTLKLLVDMHLRDQRAYVRYLSNRSVPRPSDVPKVGVITDHGTVIAFAAEQLLTTLLSRGDLQKQLTQPQLDALHRFERRPEKGWRASERQLPILKYATEFVYPDGRPDSGASASQPEAEAATRPATETLSETDVALLAMGRRAGTTVEWWSPAGEPTTVKAEVESHAGGDGVYAVFRIASQELKVAPHCMRGAGMHPFKRFDHVPGTDQWIGLIDFPDQRRYVNMLVDVSTPPWQTLYELPLTEADAGQSRRIDNYAIERVEDLTKLDERSFHVRILHGRLEGVRFAAVDKQGRAHPARETPDPSVQVTELTFDLPLGRLRGLARQQPMRYGVSIHNISLRPGVRTNPTTAFDDLERQRRDWPYELKRRAAEAAGKPFVYSLPNGAVVQLVGVTRLSDRGVEYWAPDGSPAENPGVKQADIEEGGTFIVYRVLGEARSWHARVLTEEPTRNQHLDSHVRSAQVWIESIESPSGMQFDQFAITSVNAVQYKDRARFEISAEDIEEEKQINRDGVARISNLRRLSPKSFEVEIVYSDENPARGEYFAVDKAGGLHESMALAVWSNKQQCSFDCPIEELTAMVCREPVLAWARFRGISLQPGQKTNVQAEIGTGQPDFAKVQTASPRTKPRPQWVTLPSMNREPRECVLDLASNAKLPLPNEEGDEAWDKHFMAIKKGDIAYDGQLLCFRGATAGEWKLGKLEPWEPAATSGDLRRYDLPKQQKSFLITLVNGDVYEVNPSRGSRQSGLQLQHRKSDWFKQGQPIQGVVLGPDDRPVEGARVAFASSSPTTDITNGQIDSVNRGPVVETDKNGRYSFPPHPFAYTLVAMHDEGFAIKSDKELAKDSSLRLAAWARVEGTVRIGSKPASRKDVQIEFDTFQSEKGIYLLMRCRAKTDGQGRYVMERVPPMPAPIYVSEVLRESQDGMIHTGWLHHQWIEPVAGKTLTVDLGGTGRAIVGRFAAPAGRRTPIDWTVNMNMFDLKQPEPPYPSGIRGGERQEWLEAWRKTPEGHAHMLTGRRYSIRVEEDGSFRLDDIAPGTYTLRFDVFEPTAGRGREYEHRIGGVQREIIVPEPPGVPGDEPLDIGTLELGGSSAPITAKPRGSQKASSVPAAGVATQPAGAAAPIRMEGRWPEEAEADPTGRRTRIKVPAPTSNSVLDIRGFEFIVRRGEPRVDVDFQFRDGQTAGGALFEMTLLDKNKEVLGTQRVLELRNREMPEEVFASAVLGGDDPPNRSGKAELYFRDVSLTDVDSYRLVVSEPDVAGLIQLLDEKDIYPRESAARALGQIGPAAQPAVPKLSPFLDDPNSNLRDTARKALQRIREGKPGGAASALRVNLSLEDHATGTVKITLNKTTSLRETPPGLVDVDLSAVPDGKHHIFFESPGFASQWRAVEVPLTGSPKASFDVELFRKRYVVMRCAFNVAGGRDLVGKNVEENRVAVSHWAAPKYFSEDWQVWQSSEEGDGFGKTPYLRFHRQVPGFGFAEPPTDASFDDLKQAPESGYQCRDVEPEKGMVILCRVNGNLREGRGYGKILIEDITENPPQDVRVVEGREADSSRPSAPVAATRPSVSTAPDSRAGGDLDLEELEELLKRGPLSYEEARRMIRPDQVPELCRMLKDPTFGEHWNNIATLIGYVARDDEAAVAALRDYVTRPIDWSVEDAERQTYVGHAKLGALQSIGLVGGRLADETLRQAMTPEGAEVLSKHWTKEGGVLGGFGSLRHLIQLTKHYAGIGLVLTRKPENVAMVKEAYEKERVYPKDWKERGLNLGEFNQMTQAMMINEIIEKKGMENYLGDLGSDTRSLSMLSPYFDKYLSMPPEDQEASAPASDSRSATRTAPSDVADVPVLDLNAGGNEKMRYFLIGPRPDERVPAAGYKLVVVLPGGNGGVDFHPFVCRLFKFGIPAGYIVAQPVAFAWVPDQQVVWPTRMNKVPGQQFATEDFVEAVIKDVRSKYKLDKRHIYTLSWSSGGPAAYAISLAENSPVKGSFVAMSVFKPDQLPLLDRAKGHAYYLYHSPNDRVCPYRMAEEAESMLKEKAAAVMLKTYQGGHGWKGGAVYGAVRDGIKWLERQHGDQAPSAGGGRKTLLSQPSP